jgi:hypothetical protein
MTAESAVPTATPALRRTALLCVALMAVVVMASAFLRHHGAGAALQAAWADELAMARLVHRVAATLVLLGAIAMVALARRARDAAAVRRASALLGVALLLSAVGLAGGASRVAPVVVINLLGGLAMLALCVRLAAGAADDSGGGRAAGVLLALVALQAAAGAVAGTQASPQCVLFTDCSVVAVVHRAGGMLLAPALLVWGAATAWRDQRWDGAALALIALMLSMLGVLAAGIGSRQIPVLAVAHNAFGATAVALLASRAGLRAWPPRWKMRAWAAGAH